MSENIFLNEIKPRKSGNIFLDELDSGESWGSDGPSWDELNATGPIQERPKESRPDGIFERAEKIRQKKLQGISKDGFLKWMGKQILDAPVDPGSMIGRNVREVRELFSDEPMAVESVLPEGGAASFLKGALDVPVGASQRFWNLVSPNSDKARIANDLASKFESGYRENFTPSAMNEAMGNTIPTLAMPLGRLAAGAGKLRRLAQATGVGAATGAAQSQLRPVDDAGWGDLTSEQINQQSLQDLELGAGLGGLMPGASEAVGSVGRKAAPYVKDFKGFLRDKIAKLNGVDPHAAFIGDMEASKKASSAFGSSLYDDVTSRFGQIEGDPGPFIQKLRDHIATLKQRAPEDTALIKHYEELIRKYSPGPAQPTGVLDVSGNPVMGKPQPPETPPNVENLINTRRNIGNLQEQTLDTAGRPIQRTRSGEEFTQLGEARGELDKAIAGASSGAEAGLNKANRFWAEGDQSLAAPSAFTDETRAGRVYRTLTTTDKPDVAFAGLLKGKSDVVADVVKKLISDKGKTAVQVELLKAAESAVGKGGTNPQGFVNTLLDEKTGSLRPAVRIAFEGDDLKALQGFIRLRKASGVMAKATNVAGGAAIGAATGGAGGALIGGGLASPLLWARRATWLGNWSAGMWYRMMDNPATRDALILMSKAPPASPQFARAAAAFEEAARGESE